MNQSIADTLKLESNFCLKTLIRSCKDNDKCFLAKREDYDYSFMFKDDSCIFIKDNVIIVFNDLVNYNYNSIIK